MNIPQSKSSKTLKKEAQIIVAGGGMAGICASLAAARQGFSVILIQDRPVLGGNASSEMRMHIVGANVSGKRTDTDSRESGIIEEIKLTESATNPQRSASKFDLILFDKIKEESNIDLLLNTSLYSAELEDDKILRVFASRHNTEDYFEINGDIFIDCTGDGRLGVEAGAEYMVGREPEGKFGEGLAPKTGDKKVLGSSILFATREYDREIPFEPPQWAKVYKHCSDLPFRDHDRYEYGFWWVEWGGELDTVKDNEQIRDELLSIALGVWDHIKNQVDHGADNWGLDWIGFLPCKRESRRFIGDYILKQQDLERSKIFEDQVAYGGWYIDLHPPQGIEADRPLIEQRYLDEFYSIPLRSLYSKNIRNMMIAGRDISVSHVAFGSTRVMGTCSIIGQAVGTAAGKCLEEGLTPRDLARDESKMTELQQTLLKHDCYLLGIRNEDPQDMALSSMVSASSEINGGEAENVLDGITRSEYSQSHSWVSDPQQELPQWIELNLDQKEEISEIHLTWDSGLNRPLSLSHSDRFTEKMVRGPQPETVKDYKVEIIQSDDGEVKSSFSITGNYLRKTIHQTNPIRADKIRIIAEETNGDPSARLFEIRVY